MEITVYQNTGIKNVICKHTKHSLHTLTDQANEYKQNKHLHFTVTLFEEGMQHTSDTITFEKY
jgi:hypothetical protein